LKLYQISGLQALVRKYDILKLISDDLQFMEALSPKLPSRPLSEEISEEIPALGAERGRVGFFLGCAMNLIFADTSRATIENLTRAGFRVVVPKEIQCCGTPNIAEGERKIYREMAENTIRIFADRRVDYVVTDCAACGSELKTYREIFRKNPTFAGKAEEFSNKVRDVSEFLDSVWTSDIKLGPLPEIVCFHDPCHLRHGQKLTSPQRNLLNRIPQLDYRELPDEGQCCGSAGIYNITHRNRSMRILQSKIEAIEKTKAETVISSNPGCLMQLAYGARRWNKGWNVVHISEVLNRSLRSGEKTG
jgi:glycolate oxidase iron-sulfur subunit